MQLNIQTLKPSELKIVLPLYLKLTKLIQKSINAYLYKISIIRFIMKYIYLFDVICHKCWYSSP